MLRAIVMGDDIPCPDASELERFAHGRLSARQFGSYVEHVTECQRCAQTLIELEGNTDADAVEKALRQLTEPYDATEDPLISSVRNSISSAEFAETNLAATFDRIGPFEIIDELGSGGMGRVYKATHVHLNRVVALKILPPHLRPHESMRARFEREWRSVGHFDHPHIIRAHDAGEADGQFFLAMEFVDGTDASRLVKGRGPLKVADACEIVRQAALGLAHAHQQGLVHRDIKPSNLLIGANGQVRVADFGLARLLDGSLDSSSVTEVGQVLGTPDYASPEQVENAATADSRSDIYSLGCTLYALLTGHAPFNDPRYRSRAQKLRAHAEQLVALSDEDRKRIPAAVATILTRMTAIRPDDRMPSANDVATALAPWCPDSDLAKLVGGTRNLSITTPSFGYDASRKPPRRPTVNIGAAAAGGAFLAILAVIVIVRNEKGEEVARINAGDQPNISLLYPSGVSTPLSIDSARARAAQSLLDIGAKITISTPLSSRVETLQKGSSIPTSFHVQRIDFLRNASLTPADLEHVRLFPETLELELGETPLTDQDLKLMGDLPRLTSLNVYRTHITNAGMATIGGYKSLQKLNVVLNKIDDDGVAAIAPLVNLTILRLGATNITDRSMLTIGKFRNLTQLGIQQTGITADGLRQIVGLPRLTELDVSRLTLDQPACELIAKIRQLKRLTITATGISANDLAVLRAALPTCAIAGP